MVNYRIREIHENYHTNQGFEIHTRFQYIVERRRCFFWWIRESTEILHLVDLFDTFFEAENYIKSINGKLLYIC